MIDFEHVTKVYETQNDENVALEDINIHIDEGEFVFILGHSGAGKSTFLKLIQMEEKPTEGKIYINDQDLTTIKRRKGPYLRRQMGAVFQDFRLIPTMTVYENVAFAMRVTNINNKTIKNRVPFALSLVGLEDKMDRLPDELSGGEQQRIAIARVMLKNTPIIILDEATAFADPDNETRVQAAFSKLSQGKTVIMIAHRLSTVAGADRIYVVKDGQIAESGSSRELMERGGLFARMWQNYQTSIQWKVQKEVQ